MSAYIYNENNLNKGASFVPFQDFAALASAAARLVATQ